MTISALNDPTAIYHQLSNRMFEILRAQDKGALADQLKAISDAIWGDGNGTPALDTKARRARIQQIYAQIPTSEDKLVLMEHFSRLGALNDMAAHLGRSRFMAQQFTDQGKALPDSLAEFVSDKSKSVQDAVDRLARVTYSPVFTAHPTNNSSIEFMEKMHDLMASYEALAKNPSEEAEAQLNGALVDIVNTAATPNVVDIETGVRKDANLSAYDETKVMLNYLGNIVDGMPDMYAELDTALQKKALTNGETYDPFAVRLNVKPKSWGSSGDKDGNPKINATTTLLAVLQHKTEAMERQSAALATVLAHGDQIPETERTALQEKATKLSASATAYKELRDAVYGAVHKKTDNSLDILSDEAFADYQQQLNAIKADEPELRTAQDRLKAVYEASTDAATKADALRAFRQIRDFGSVIAPIEMRETAEEVTRVAAMFMTAYNGKDYTAMNETQRQAVLSQMLESGKLPELYAQLSDQLKAAATKPYSAPAKGQPDSDALRAPIAYQTLKRYELFRDVPEMCHDHVLAEAENASNLLEVMLLSKAVEKNGKKPIFNIQPLFEQPENLITEAYEVNEDAKKDLSKKVDVVMRSVLRNPQYQQHLLEFAAAHPDECIDGKPMQILQLAHSDNGRRGGMAAARAAIAIANDAMRTVQSEIRAEFPDKLGDLSVVTYHGGSASDPYRGGIRAPAAKVRDYGLKRLFKETLQGGDLMNIFNHPFTLVRHLGGILAYCAKHTEKAPEPLNALDQLAARAAVGTLDYYKTHHFTKDNIGAFLGAVVEDNLEIVAGARGSRQQRNPITITTEMLPRAGSDKVLDPKYVRTITLDSLSLMAKKTPEMWPVKFLDPNGVRTITFSELFSENQIVPTWLGMLPLAENLWHAQQTHGLVEQYKPKTKFVVPAAATVTAPKSPLVPQAKPYPWRESLKEPAKPQAVDDIAHEQLRHFFGGQGEQELSAEVLKKMYDSSSVFRDMIDRAAYGLAKSDLDSVLHYTPVLTDPKAPEALQAARNYMANLQVEYAHAAKLVVAAMTGKYPQHTGADLQQGKTMTEIVRNTVRAIPSLSYLNGHEADTDAYLDTAQTLKHSVMPEFHAIEDKMKHNNRVQRSLKVMMASERLAGPLEETITELTKHNHGTIPTVDELMDAFPTLKEMREGLVPYYKAYVAEHTNQAPPVKDLMQAGMQAASAAAEKTSALIDATHDALRHAAITLHQAMDWAIHKPVLEAQDRGYARARAAQSRNASPALA